MPGKSSLMNILLDEDRAIVTDIAGTTRDALQESVRLGGLMLNLIDTAGIHNTEDTVEKLVLIEQNNILSRLILFYLWLMEVKNGLMKMNRFFH